MRVNCIAFCDLANYFYQVSDCEGDVFDDCHVVGGADLQDGSQRTGCSSILYDEIGTIIKPGMSCNEILASIKQLTSGQKYKLLTNHFIPCSDFKFPKTFKHGCNRQFQLKWLDKYSWLVYSKDLSGGFCKYCALFVTDRSKCVVFVNTPFQNWI